MSALENQHFTMLSNLIAHFDLELIDNNEMSILSKRHGWQLCKQSAKKRLSNLNSPIIPYQTLFVEILIKKKLEIQDNLSIYF